MAVFELKFPHIDSGSDLTAKVVTRGSFPKKVIDIDDKTLPQLRVGIFPGWGVRSDAMCGLAKEVLARSSPDHEAILVASQDYMAIRPEHLSNLEYWRERRRISELSLMNQRSVLMPYSEACLSIGGAVSSVSNSDEFTVTYLQGPFFNSNISTENLTKRFLVEGVCRSVGFGNWSSLFSYSAGLVSDILLRPSTFLNAISDGQLIGRGVDLTKIPTKAIAFNSDEDCIFPYREARNAWDSIGRGDDVVKIKDKNGGGHLFPMAYPSQAANIVIGELRRRFGEEVI